MLVHLVVQKKLFKLRKLSARKRMTNAVILAAIVLASMSIADDIIRKRETVYYPSIETPINGIESTNDSMESKAKSSSSFLSR